MLAEKDCPREQRYLFSDIRFGTAALSHWKEVCKQKVQEGLFPKTTLTKKYLDWEASDKEIALFTNYAYADLGIPKSFSCLFDLKNPEKMLRTDILLKQSIFEAYFPVDHIDHGHKHLCIFEFQNQLPSLIYEIEKMEEGIVEKSPQGITIGICQREDFPYIRKSIESKNQKAG